MGWSRPCQLRQCFESYGEGKPVVEKLSLVFLLATENVRHTYTTRLLYTVVPPENHAPKNKTVDLLLEALVSDMNKLQEEGIEAINNFCLHFNPPNWSHIPPPNKNPMSLWGVKSFGFLLVGDWNCNCCFSDWIPNVGPIPWAKEPDLCQVLRK